MSSSYNHRPSSFNPYFSNHNNVVSREMAPADMADNDMALWSNAQFTLDSSPGLRLLEDDSLVPPLPSEDCDPASGRKVFQQPLAKPLNVNQMSAASGLTPFLPQATMPNPGVTMSPSPSNPLQASDVNNFPAIYPSPASSQRTLHSNRMSEELLQGQLSNPQPIIINSTTQQTSPILQNPSTLDITPLQSGLLTPPMTMIGHNYYDYSHMMDPNYVCQLLAEEDKRRRNTAASARFRVKKKLREQALERASRDMTTKAELLENKVRELEKEIQWLRSLLTEKDPRLLEIARPDKQQDDDQD
ncbi:15088_t:CDS:1 [Acaulospora colombiana]|uniref:15088_t:CDS:1 n=1 Tax=Acaulospora colombiana TaxID=27376 RepID=A0ACA9KYR1_9GLOM|nr:15088_t:CDS:1 [Acaulospora colombiana]